MCPTPAGRQTASVVPSASARSPVDMVMSTGSARCWRWGTRAACPTRAAPQQASPPASRCSRCRSGQPATVLARWAAALGPRRRPCRGLLVCALLQDILGSSIRGTGALARSARPGSVLAVVCALLSALPSRTKAGLLSWQLYAAAQPDTTCRASSSAWPAQSPVQAMRCTRVPAALMRSVTVHLQCRPPAASQPEAR